MGWLRHGYRRTVGVRRRDRLAARGGLGAAFSARQHGRRSGADKGRDVLQDAARRLDSRASICLADGRGVDAAWLNGLLLHVRQLRLVPEAQGMAMLRVKLRGSQSLVAQTVDPIAHLAR
jgi:hypothetical protein